MSLIITIGRQFGSGGRDVGEKVAEYFNIPFYDKELVELAAQKSNISKEALKEVDEHATNSFLYSLASGNYSMRGINAPIYYEMPINDKLFIAQADVIKEVAKRGSCVIVGRCADYVLEKAYDPQDGARPLRRAIQNELEDFLADEYLEGHIKNNDKILLDIEKDKPVIQKERKKKKTE